MIEGARSPGRPAGPVVGRYVGASVLRKEDPRLLAGKGTFVDDIVQPQMLHVAFVRSAYARANILDVDTARAKELHGVHAVFTIDDLRGQADFDAVSNHGKPPFRPLADGAAHFAGEPIAMVIAESRYLAEDACELIEVRYEPLSPLLDFERAAAETGILVHPALGSNVVSVQTGGDPAAAEEVIRSAPHVFEELFRQHRYVAAPMETRGVVARWTPFANQLTVWISSQSVHLARDHCAKLLGLSPPQVRVVMGDVGGAFGQKLTMLQEETCVVIAARLLGGAIKWIEDRAENLAAATHSRNEAAKVTVAVDDEGHLLAATFDHTEDVGSGGTATGFLAIRMFPGPYRIGVVATSTTAVYTNTCRRGAYRGPWMFESVVRETMLDIVARQLAIDPLELRRRNVIHQRELPLTTATGMTYDVVSPEETLDQAVRLLGYEDFRRDQATALTNGRYLGVGISLYVEPSGVGIGGMAQDGANIRVDGRGAVQVSMGTGSHGQSLETTISQVVADELGVDIDDVVFVDGDTASVPIGTGTQGSRSAVIASGAAREAGRRMRHKVLEIAAHTMELSVEDLVIERGLIAVRGTPTRSMTIAEVASLAYSAAESLPAGMEPGLEATVRVSTPVPFTFSNAAHVCTCEVDVETGCVTLLRYVVSEDCGTMINPMVVEGQIAGGVAQGIGGVLLEHFVYDEDGNPLTTTLLDYLVPTAADVPTIEYGHIETPSNRPGGHKGMGEGGAIGAPPAIINAVADALAPFGIKLTSQPLSPARILGALDASREGAPLLS